MQFSQNTALCKYTNRINLNLLSFGDAVVDSEWNGVVSSPPFSRLYYISEGEFTIIDLNGKIYTLDSGKWHLIPSGYSFSFSCQEKMEHFYFHLKICDLDGTDLLEHIKEPLNMEFPFDRDFFSKCISSDDFLCGMKLCNILREIIFSFICKGNIRIYPEDYSPCICNALLYIKHNLSMQLTVPEIAENCFVSKSTLTKHFKKELSVSVNEYISNMVLSEAERLLLTKNTPLLEISQKLGFSDQFYFSRKFKEKFGISPREYRKKRLI